MATLDVLLPPAYTPDLASETGTSKGPPKDIKARIRHIQQSFHRLHWVKDKKKPRCPSAASVRVPIYCCEEETIAREQLAELGLPTVTDAGQPIDYEVIARLRTDDEELPAYRAKERGKGFKNWVRHQYRARELVQQDGSIIWDEVAGLCIVIFFTAVVVIAIAVVMAALI